MTEVERPKTSSFILTLELACEPHQIELLNRRFFMAEHLYNQVLKKAKNSLTELKRNKQYKRLLKELKLIKTLEKEELKTTKESSYTPQKEALNEQLTQLKLRYGVSEYSLHTYVKKQQALFSQHIDSLTAQKLASTVWASVSSNLYRKGKRMAFKKHGQLTSVEGKNNASGIRFKDGWLTWNGLLVQATVRPRDWFAQESLANHRVKYCRIVKKIVRGKVKYYVQLILEGTPPPKRLKDGSFKRKPSPTERVGLDIGPSSLAIVSKNKCRLVELAAGLENYDKQKRLLQRKLDRSKRKVNPQNFNKDGTIKKGVKLKWVRSNRYLKTLYQLKDIERRRAAYRKQSHEKLANQILTLGNEVYIETMRWKALQKKSTQTEVSEKTGRFKRKKRFGKSIGNHAPSLLMDILSRKLGYQHKVLNKVNTTTFKASQLNHVTGDYQKKELKERWNLIEGEKIQRDLYAAFLIMNAQDDLKKTDLEQCHLHYETFKLNHHYCLEEIKQNTTKKRLKSFGF